MDKEYIKRAVSELIDRVSIEARAGLEKIMEKATDEQLDEPNAINDIYTALFSGVERQLKPNPRYSSRKECKRSAAAVTRFWYLTK